MCGYIKIMPVYLTFSAVSLSFFVLLVVIYLFHPKGHFILYEPEIEESPSFWDKQKASRASRRGVSTGAMVSYLQCTIKRQHTHNQNIKF